MVSQSGSSSADRTFDSARPPRPSLGPPALTSFVHVRSASRPIRSRPAFGIRPGAQPLAQGVGLHHNHGGLPGRQPRAPPQTRLSNRTAGLRTQTRTPHWRDVVGIPPCELRIQPMPAVPVSQQGSVTAPPTGNSSVTPCERHREPDIGTALQPCPPTSSGLSGTVAPMQPTAPGADLKTIHPSKLPGSRTKAAKPNPMPVPADACRHAPMHESQQVRYAADHPSGPNSRPKPRPVDRPRRSA